MYVSVEGDIEKSWLRFMWVPFLVEQGRTLKYARLIWINGKSRATKKRKKKKRGVKEKRLDPFDPWLEESHRENESLMPNGPY